MLQLDGGADNDTDPVTHDLIVVLERGLDRRVVDDKVELGAGLELQLGQQLGVRGDGLAQVIERRLAGRGLEQRPDRVFAALEEADLAACSRGGLCCVCLDFQPPSFTALTYRPPLSSPPPGAGRYRTGQETQPARQRPLKRRTERPQNQRLSQTRVLLLP